MPEIKQREEAQLITFGKYKGKPVEVLQSDPEYCEWLRAQGWFTERYPQINTLIINNFSKAEDTPAHNSLQARFVAENFISMFCSAIFSEIKNSKRNSSLLYEKEGMKPGDIEIKHFEFEVKGWDVAIFGKIVKEGINKLEMAPFCVFVEIKPELGDDYPSILRQMKTNRFNCSLSDISAPITAKDITDGIEYRYVLIYDKFTASGANPDQVKKIFLMSDFFMLSFCEAETVHIDNLSF